jgi:hypothetical protein
MSGANASPTGRSHQEMIALPRTMRAFFAAFLVVASSIAAFAQDRRQDPISEPLSFQPNLGQEASRVRFTSNGPGYRLLITDQDATIRLQKPGDKSPSNLRMTLLNGQTASAISSSDPLSIRNNYYIGNDSREWITDVPGFGKVHLRDVYRGVDLVYYGNEGQVEYDFIVAPGSDPRKIAMVFEGAQSLHTKPNGDLELSLGGGHVVLKRPITYQERDGRRLIIPSSYVVDNNRHVRFNLGSYDSQLPLIIDPTISILEYLDGGPGFSGTGRGIAVDSAGVTYVTGYSTSGVFSTNNEVFVKKFDPAGSPRWTTTTLGGGGDDKPKDIALDSSGNVYVIGSTQSANYPTVGSPLQTNAQTDNSGTSDVFITKLSPTLAALYSTYFGGNGVDFGDSIAVSNCNGTTCEIAIAGTTGSTNLNTTLGVAFTNFSGTANAAGNNNGFVARLIDNGTQLSWETTPFAMYLGAIASRTSGTQDSGRRNLSVAGSGTDIFVAGARTSGAQTNANVWKVTGITYSKLLHTDSGKTSFANAIAVDTQGNAHVAGETNDLHFPIHCIPADQFCQPFYNGTMGATSLDGFYAKLDVGSVVLYGTYLGSPGIGGSNVDDLASAVALTPAGDVLVAGKAGDQTFPHQGTALNFVGTNNGFLAGFSSTQVLFASTFLSPSLVGGAHQAESVAVFANGDAMVLGTSTTGATQGPWIAQVDMLAAPPVGPSTFSVTVDTPQPACPVAEPLALPPCYFSEQNPNLNPPPQIATVTVGLTDALPQTSSLSIELLDSANNPINQITEPTYVSTTGPLTISADRKTFTFGILYRATPPPGLAAIRLRAAIGNQKCSPGDTKCYGNLTIVGLPAISAVTFAPNYVPVGALPIYGTPGKLVSGNTTTGKVTLNAGAVYPINVFLTSNNTSAAAVSPSTQVAGAIGNPVSTSNTFSITAGQVAGITPVTITASLSSAGAGTSSGFGTLYILPDLKLPALPIGLTLNPNTVNGVYSGTPIVATATLANGALVPNDPLYPAAGLTFSLIKVENGNQIVVATGSIPRGQGSGSVTFQADAVTQTTFFTMQARIDAGPETNLSYSLNTSLKVIPITVAGLTLSSASVPSGADLGGTVTISAPAPVGGISVAMTLPGGLTTNVTVAEGGTTAEFDFTAPEVQSATNFIVKAELNGSTQTAPLTVLAASPATVLFTSFNADVALGLHWGDDRDTFRVKGDFSLGNASNGINPVTEQVMLKVGPYSVTIPAGSFKLNGDRDGDGNLDRHGHREVRRFRFKGTINGVVLDVRIRYFGNNEYELRAHGRKADLTGVVKGQPITVELAIGDDSGQAIDQKPKTRIKDAKFKVTVDLDKRGDRDTFKVDGGFVFEDDGNLNPVTQAATLQIGPYSVTIPAGSFKTTGKGPTRDFTFKGTVDGDTFEIRIRDLGHHEWDLSAQGRKLLFGEIANGTPVTVSLTIGSATAEADDLNPKVK